MKSTQVSAERKKELKLFQKNSGLRFKSLELLNLAFCHRSYSNEGNTWDDNNEKLEFLGDSVLGLVVTEYLYKAFPEDKEGDLARIKSFVVSEDSLAIIARKIRIDNFILIGKGEENSGGRQKKAILADAMEAIIGAYYLDTNIDTARKFLLKYFVPEIDKVKADKHKKDYKTLLQEYVQKRFKIYPKYQLIKKTGPDHNRTFWMSVQVKSKIFGPCEGKNKKEAEQKAAALAYENYVEPQDK